MKKTLFVAALVAMLVFAVVGSAYAVNQSDQTYLGARTEPTVTRSGTGLPTASGGVGPVVNQNYTDTNVYENWSTLASTKPGDAGQNSPHGNYTTTTIKCVVCHAVHYAAPAAPSPTASGSYAVGSGNQMADTLLRVKAGQACVYCHATAGEAVNGRPVYNGLGGTIITPANTSGNNNVGHTTGVNCSTCHTNVHGAGADESVAALQGYLLNQFTTSGVNGDPSATTNDMIEAIALLNSRAGSQGLGRALPASTGTYATDSSSTYREQAVGVFCAECHNGSYAAGTAGASASVRSGATTDFYTGHRIAAAATTSWNSDGTKSSGLQQNITVAWADAQNCKSCHDATDDYGNVSFPHAWGKYNVDTDTPFSVTSASSKMWLQMAENAGAVKTPVGAASSADTDDLQLQDGVCLKCHVSNDGNSGVGITF